MAGVSRLQYTTDIRLIRTMCSGRVDLDHVLRAFSNGSDAVFIGGCRLNECNYITHGNYDALNMVLLCKRIMEHVGLNPDRLRIQFASSAEGNLFAEVISYYIAPEKCPACMICGRSCPVEAIAGGKNLIHVIDQAKCIKCNTCFEVCPDRFGAVTKISGAPVPPAIPEEKRAIVRKGKENVAG